MFLWGWLNRVLRILGGLWNLRSGLGSPVVAFFGPLGLRVKGFGFRIGVECLGFRLSGSGVRA